MVDQEYTSIEEVRRRKEKTKPNENLGIGSSNLEKMDKMQKDCEREEDLLLLIYEIFF